MAISATLPQSTFRVTTTPMLFHTEPRSGLVRFQQCDLRQVEKKAFGQLTDLRNVSMIGNMKLDVAVVVEKSKDKKL